MENNLNNDAPISENFKNSEAEENQLNSNCDSLYNQRIDKNSYQSSENQFQVNNFSEQLHNNYEDNSLYQNNGNYIPEQQETNFEIHENYFGKNSNNDFSKIELNKMRSVSVATISIFICWAVLLILIIVLLISINMLASSETIKSFSSYASTSKTGSGATANSKQELLTFLNTTLTCFEWIFGIFWVIGILTCGVVGAVIAWDISEKWRSFLIISILYIIGIFITPIQFIIALISLFKTKKIS